MFLNKYMHPRNIYKEKKPDFKSLAIKYPEFRKFVTQELSGKVSLDYKNPDNLRALTITLLKEDFRLDVELPHDRLIPTLPLRLNYIHWLEDILGDKDNVKGIDIGTGASCIYPLLGHRLNKWKFLATEVDEQNFQFAERNVNKNGLQNEIKVQKAPKGGNLCQALEDSDDKLTFCMCNPPFFSSHLDAQAALTSRTKQRPKPSSLSTASCVEAIAEGGELEFIKAIMEDSVKLKDRIWIYSSMVGKKSTLPLLKKELKRLKIPKFATMDFCQGRTMRWGLAWSFDENVHFPKSSFQSREKEKQPLSFVISKDIPKYEVLSVRKLIEEMLNELKIEYSEIKTNKWITSLSLTARINTWSHHRRKRRQQQRETTVTANSREVKKDKLQIAETSVEGNSLQNMSTDQVAAVPQTTEHCKERVTETEMGEEERGDDADQHPKRGRLENNEMSTHENRSNYGNKSVTNVKTQEKLQHLKTAECCRVDLAEGISSNSNADYIFKCTLTLKRKGELIFLELSWIDGTNREMLHQVMQYFKNRL